MLDNNIKIEKKEAKVYPPIPKDVYQVELLDVNSTTKATYDSRNLPEDQREMETVLEFQFTLLEGKMGEENLRGRNLWDNFIPSYLYIGKKGKNKLYRVVEALIGRELTLKEEAEGISGKMLNDLIGRQCRLSVEPKTKGEKTYDIIIDFLKANQQLTPLTSEEKQNATVNRDNKPQREDKEEDIEVVDDLSNIPF